MNPLSVAAPARRGDEFQADYAVHAGTVLRAELDARQLSQADLALRTGLSPKHVNQIVQGVVPLSAEVALLLERTLGVPSRVWNALEANHRDAVTRAAAQERLAAHASWLEQFPVKELVRRGVLSEVGGVGARVEQLLTFFRVADPATWERVYAEPVAAFRRAQHLSPSATGTAVWLRLAEQAAERLRDQLSPAAYSARAFRRLLPELRALTTNEDTARAFSELQRRCAQVGVLVVFVPQLKGTGVNGATRWIGDHPLIALSDRYKYADTFWFSFFHEAGHVLLHPRRRTYVALADKGDDQDGHEAVADAYARDLLIPPDHEADLAHINRPAEATRLAQVIGVHPGIVAGRIAHQSGDWQFAAKLRCKVNFVDAGP
jgi:HTH-type transcriptional regulator/antitoxin HigA